MRTRFAVYLFTLSMVVSPCFGQGVWLRDSSNGLQARSNPASCPDTSRLFVFGGDNGGGPRPAPIQYFDPLNHSWYSLPTTSSDTLSTIELSHGVFAATIGDKIYVVGAAMTRQPTYNYPDTVAIFDPQTLSDRLIPTTGSHTSREYFIGATIETRIYLIGGYIFDPSGMSSPIADDFDVFDTQTNHWSTIPTRKHYMARLGTQVAVFGNKLYIFGGYDRDGISFADSVDIYDPTSDNWSTPSARPPLPLAIDGGAIALNDRIYIIAGAAGRDETYQPALDKWSELHVQRVSRERFSLSVLKGKIYCIGGYTPHAPLSDVEVFDPNLVGVNASAPQSQNTTLFPNPTTGQLAFANLPTDVTRIVVSTLLGEVLEDRVVKAHETNAHIDVDLSGATPGTYFVRIISPGSIIMRKVVKE
jgi:hypothetical protein